MSEFAAVSNVATVAGTVPLALLAIVAVALWVAGVIDGLRHPQWAWRSAGHSRDLALVLMVFLPVIGAVIYLLVIRNDVARISHRGRSNGTGFNDGASSGHSHPVEHRSPAWIGPTVSFGSFGAPVPPAAAPGRIQLSITAARPFVPTVPPQTTLVRERIPTAPAGWKDDPTGRHQFRFWDGYEWTGSVADSGVRTTDPFTA